MSVAGHIVTALGPEQERRSPAVTSTTSGQRVHAPSWPPALSAATAVLAILTAVLDVTVLTPPSRVVLLAGYLLGAVGTVAFASVYRALRNSRRRDPRFRVQRGLDTAVAWLTGVGVVAGMVNAALLATELAK
jgi:hypothetical protein